MIWKVSFELRWSRIHNIVSLALRSGRPLCEPERSITNTSSFGAASCGATCFGGNSTKLT
jgi:hypothetical protein